MKLFVIGSIEADTKEEKAFQVFCTSLGNSLAGHRMTLVLCSPYPGSCDAVIVEGIKSHPAPRASLELHYPGTAANEKAWDTLL